MARKKLPDNQVLKTVGIKLADSVIAELEQLGAEWDCKPSAAGRDLLLLGLAVYRAAKDSRIFRDSQTDTISKEELRSRFNQILNNPSSTPANSALDSHLDDEVIAPLADAKPGHPRPGIDKNAQPQRAKNDPDTGAEAIPRVSTSRPVNKRET